MTAQEYIWAVCPGRMPTDRETLAVIAWCHDWAYDTFDEDEVPASTLQLLRGCDHHIDGGLAFVLADVRRCETGRTA